MPKYYIDNGIIYKKQKQFYEYYKKNDNTYSIYYDCKVKKCRKGITFDFAIMKMRMRESIPHKCIKEDHQPKVEKKVAVVKP